jgi:hypothetical protein
MNFGEYFKVKLLAFLLVLCDLAYRITGKVMWVKRVHGGWLFCEIGKPVRFYSGVAGITKSMMEGVVLVLVVLLINQYVISSQAIFNTTASSIAATVVPIIQAALLIVAIFGAIGIIYYAAANQFSSGREKK